MSNSNIAGEEDSTTPYDCLYCLRKGQSRTPKLPRFDWTGTLKLHPISKPQLVPDHIEKPDWALDGTPKVEPSSDLHRVVEIAQEVLDAAAQVIQPGVTTDEIDVVVHKATIAAVGDAIDKELGMSKNFTRKMMKKAVNEANPPEAQVPEKLNHYRNSRKRFKDIDDKINMTFMPEWGICEQDSVAGSGLLAVDWSKCSITPVDMANVVSHSKIEDIEQLGAQAIYKANLFFQSIIQSKALREKAMIAFQDKTRIEKEAKEWKARAYSAEKRLASYKKKYLDLEHKVNQEHDAIINEYLGSDAFLKFMDDHDDFICRYNLTLGWNQAIDAISLKHPEVVSSAFPSLNWVVGGRAKATHASTSGTKMVHQASGFSSRGTRQSSGSKVRLNVLAQE